MRNKAITVALSTLLVAGLLRCSSGSPVKEKDEQSSALKDYVVRPLEKAKGAKVLVEKKYEQGKKEWDRLSE